MRYSFKWIGGATWVLTAGNIKIACDPVLCPAGTVQDYRFFKSVRLDNPVLAEGDLNGVNYWLVTHLHEDHLDKKGWEAIKSGRIISSARIEGKENAVILKWDDAFTSEIGDGERITITAIPAIHSAHAYLGNMVGKGCGYYVEYVLNGESFRLYVSGDTLIHNPVIKALRDKPIDVAILNAGAATVGKGLLSAILGRITMNKRDVIRFYKRFQPKRLIPVHFGAFGHYRETLNQSDFEGYSGITVIQPGETLSE